MPLRDFRCETCGKESEQFYWASQGEPTVCECGGKLAKLDLESRRHSRVRGAFPFVTKHISGDPMEITDMAHLRRVEKQWGVVLSAFSNEEHNSVDNIKDLPKFRGDEIRRRRGR